MCCRTCRCGAGKEETPGQADTPGFPLTDVDTITEHVKNGFKVLNLKRTEGRFKQTSKPMLNSWRANCDVQLLIYECDLDDIKSDDLARVVSYVCAYTCKGSATYEYEKKMLCNLVAASKSSLCETYQRETATLAAKMLNSMVSQRVISKGECSVELLGLDLYRCTEQITHISLSTHTNVRRNPSKQTTFNNKSIVVAYALRRGEVALTLTDYFYKHYSLPKTTKTETKLSKKGKYPCINVFPFQFISYSAVPHLFQFLIYVLYQIIYRQIKTQKVC